MMNPKIIVGLDIGTTKVCAVVGKKNEYGKIDILGIGRSECDGVRRGEVINIDKTANAISHAVNIAATHANVDIHVVIASIGGENVRSLQKNSIITLGSPNQQITANDVHRLAEEVKKIAVPPGSEIIHVLPQEYAVDNHFGVHDPIGMSGIRLECNYHVVTAQSNSIRNIKTCIEKAGLSTAALVLQPLASSLAVLSEDEMEAGVCVVDIGGGTTDLAIFSDHVIRHTTVVPIGGNIITDDIRKGCSLLVKPAETVKTRFGWAMADEESPDEIITIGGSNDRQPKEIRRYTLSRIIQSRTEELAELVLKEIHQAGFFRNLTSGIVLTGGGAQLQRIQDLFAYVTGMETRIGKPSLHLDKGLVEEANHPMYATAIGLIVYGFNHLEEQQAVSSVKAELKDTKGNNRTSMVIENIKNYFDSVIKNTNPLD
jgi:cell division protein FtsA